MDWVPDLRQLRAFVAVVEEGSFTLAADGSAPGAALLRVDAARAVEYGIINAAMPRGELDARVDALVATSRHSDLLLKHAGLATRAGDTAWREFLVRRALEFNPDDLNVLMAMADGLQALPVPGQAVRLDWAAEHTWVMAA